MCQEDAKRIRLTADAATEVQPQPLLLEAATDFVKREPHPMPPPPPPPPPPHPTAAEVAVVEEVAEEAECTADDVLDLVIDSASDTVCRASGLKKSSPGFPGDIALAARSIAQGVLGSRALTTPSAVYWAGVAAGCMAAAERLAYGSPMLAPPPQFAGPTLSDDDDDDGCDGCDNGCDGSDDYVGCDVS